MREVLRLLLDTHAFLWFVFGQRELSSVAATAILDPRNEVYISLVSMWETGIKHALGRLDLRVSPTEFFATQIPKNGFEHLPLEPVHVFAAAALPQNEHRDPFDRALVGQALVEGLTLVTADPKLDRYGVPRLF